LARRERDLSTALAEEAAARLAVEHSLADAESARKRAEWQAASDLAAAAQRHAVLEDRLAQSETVYATLEARLAAAQIARDDADERHAGQLAELRGRLANLQALHDATVTARGHDIAQLQQERDGLRRQLNVMRTHTAAIRNEADRVAGLQLQLAESQKEIRRQFERAPYGLFECTREGAITRVNNVLARLLGYRASLDAPREDFVTAVFECAGDLQWLLERAEPAGHVQSVETTLKTRDRRRLFVRLHALTTGKAILVAVEDLTKLSTLEQRVREAHRLEAVGRVASEVAVTCDTLLRDVTRGGQQWLAGFESDTSLRQQGELLLGDVTRAAGLLRQFADYGHTQITNVEPVSMPRVLQDMKLVLERVLGGDIELTLPKTTRAFGAFDVDVEASRVERILVNVANYARERMPQGGHVRIQLATTIVDQRFLASHPKVRPGAHVVITISEVQGATRPTLPIQWPTADPHGRATLSPMEKPGMDLGPLMALIGDLGGHLWMSVEPAGNVTLQIHLPKRTQDEVMEPAARGALTARRRQLAKWFRH
jgi:PAS domain-containing protein